MGERMITHFVGDGCPGGHEVAGVGRVWVKDPAWVLLTTTTILTCSRGFGPKTQACTNTPVAKLKRPSGWWPYCAKHMYGRRIEDGQVKQEVDADSPLALEARGTMSNA